MSDKLELSIIVPVYNSKETLQRCVESLTKQTMKSLEIILVDDGATDGSDILCDEYRQKDSRIRVIHQKNKGPLAARVAGCKIACGKYIAFVDSDDWIEENAYERLCSLMADVDMVAAGVIRTGPDGSVMGYHLNLCKEGCYSLNDPSFLENVFFFKHYTPGGGVAAVMDGPWNKIFRRSLILNFIDKLDVYIREFEDWLFNSLYILQCKNIRVTCESYYHYVTNQSSIGHTGNPKFLEQQSVLYNIIKEAVDEHPWKTLLLKQIQKKLMYNILSNIGVKLDFDEEAKIPAYHFPKHEILKGKNIVLFGAGHIGKSYLIDLKKRGYDVVLWVDNMSQNVHLLGKTSVRPDEIQSMDYDYVVCAVRGKLAAKEIRNQLMNMGVNDEKILWEDPMDTWGEYLSS